MTELARRFVLGTAQFGLDYGIANVSGQPTRKEAFRILEMAWERGIRTFDTAPGYATESLLGEFFLTHGITDEVSVLTKIPTVDSKADYKNIIQTSIHKSTDLLGVCTDTVFFHDPKDSKLFLDDPEFFRMLLKSGTTTNFGVSVYEPGEVKRLEGYASDLAFQYPYNIIDVRFQNIIVTKGKRYARSIFLQGLLANNKALRDYAPASIIRFHKEYHAELSSRSIHPIVFAVAFVLNSSEIDHLIVGVDNVTQLIEIMDVEVSSECDSELASLLRLRIQPNDMDPRRW
jgi:aryl-alcohol dehydrogenase-like predicted oxidoreductase